VITLIATASNKSILTIFLKKDPAKEKSLINGVFSRSLFDLGSSFFKN